MNYPSIRIEGAILSADLLERLEEAPGQRPADFNLESTARVKDEIARAWADAQDYWRIFQRKLEGLKSDSPGTTETRQQWMVPLLGLLGYQLEYQAKGAEIHDKLYNISHRASNRAQAPVQIVGYREPAGLDRKPERTQLRMSAHAVVQEYLNLSEQLYGLVTNGRVLRLLRDSSRLIKLNYIEFDLDRIFTDGLFADFAVLFRLLHATRLPLTSDTASQSLIERYHQDALEQGTRIRDGLRASVTEALELLGTGFLAHPGNRALREQIDSGALEHGVFFGQLMRLIYRLLFLNVVEERGLVFPKGTPRAKVRTYFDHYSVQRLRRLARTRGLRSERHHDAWLSLLSTFQLFEHSAQATKLGTTAFSGQLFDSRSLGVLASCQISNAAFFQALDRLCSFDDPKTHIRLPVNFGALATEEFGSVYESLLELHPVIETAPSPSFGFRQAAGNDRKTSGSYYTPSSLVDCLLDSALDPVLEERVTTHKALGYPSAEAALLALKVCDPACGSGHFLIAAAQRIARRLALVRAGDEEPSPDQLRRAIREVISHCIYAVDINPMAVELCRVALWLEAVQPGKPLSFLDHHVRVGNSLLGATPELIAGGIPDEAFNAIEGDDKKACTLLRKRNKTESSSHPLFAHQMAATQLILEKGAATLAALPEDRPEDILRKEDAFRQLENTPDFRYKKLLADVWCAAFVVKKTFKPHHDPRYVTGEPLGVTHSLLTSVAERQVASHNEALVADCVRLAEIQQFFHWHLAFPEVFAQGGFDVMLGNPPWERIEIQEQEWFAARCFKIANAPNAAARKRLISALQDDDPNLYAAFSEDRRRSEGENHFLHDSNRFPLCGRGKLNTYAVFAELIRQLLGSNGHSGCILPSGIATDDTTKHFFASLIETGSLACLYDFENEDRLFPAVHHAMKFCLLMTGPPRPSRQAALAFFARQVEHVHEEWRRFTLNSEDTALLNPNTRTCPTFRSKRDAEITKHIYHRVPILINDGPPESNPWCIRFRQGLFNMATDSGLFHTDAQLQGSGFIPEGSHFVRGTDRYLPLYEAKMVHHFDHRFSTYDGQTDSQANMGKCPELTDTDHADPHHVVLPRYWVPEAEVNARLGDRWDRDWLLGWRDITNTKNERTVIASIIPRVAVGHTAPVVLSRRPSAELSTLYVNLASLVLDYCARQKVGGTHLTYGYLQQLPVLPPETYGAHCPWHSSTTLLDWILPRVLELTYTAWDVAPFARDCGYDGPPFRWDPDRRFQLRCELDAAFFHLYGIPRDDVAYIMDTFPIVRRKDEAAHGEYRTRRVILEIYDAMADAQSTRQPYRTRLTPPPAAPECCHPPR